MYKDPAVRQVTALSFTAATIEKQPPYQVMRIAV
jgi:hypothetical protein